MSQPNSEHWYRSRISRQLTEAIEKFKQQSHYEKEISSNSLMVERMIDHAMHQALLKIIEERPEEDIIQYLSRAAESFQSTRAEKRTSSNPIRTYRRSTVSVDDEH